MEECRGFALWLSYSCKSWSCSASPWADGLDVSLLVVAALSPERRAAPAADDQRLGLRVLGPLGLSGLLDFISWFPRLVMFESSTGGLSWTAAVLRTCQRSMPGQRFSHKAMA